MNISMQYQKSLSKEQQQALALCSHLADDMDIKIYLVGGIVRDIILNRNFNDIDILIEDDAILFAEILQKKYSKNIEIIAKNEKFKTVKLNFKIGNKTFQADLASTRSEVYEYPSALPILAETSVSLQKDIKRRDFTINSLAMSLNANDFCQIYDETQMGLEDLSSGLIRILHPDSFMDDPSRIVRALKYRTKLNFILESDTQYLQKECLNSDKYTNDCQERIKKEIAETLNLFIPGCFDKFITENIYKLIIGQISKKDIPNDNLICQIVRNCLQYINPENIWIIFLCIIFNYAPQELALKNIEKLALKKKEHNILIDFFEIQSKICKLKDAKQKYDIYNFFNNYCNESIVAALVLCKEPEICEKIYSYLNKLQHIKLHSTGMDIKNMGIENGEIYKEILSQTLKEKINNSLSDTEEKAYLKKYCTQIKNSRPCI